MNDETKAIKQKHDMEKTMDEQDLKLDKMRAEIERAKALVEKLSGNNDDRPIQIMIKRKGDRS